MWALSLGFWASCLHCQQLKLGGRSRKLCSQTVTFLLGTQVGGEKGLSNNRSCIQNRLQWPVFFILRATWWPIHNKKKRVIFISPMSLFHVLSSMTIDFFVPLREYIQYFKCHIVILLRNSFAISNRERLQTVFLLQVIKVKGKSPPV